MILHIPHSSDFIPYKEDYIENFDDSLLSLTDWYTDELFFHKNSERLVVPYSRFWCDVERLRDDSKEEMYKKGHGVVYTKDNYGHTIRNVSVDYTRKIKTLYYDVHHTKFTRMVNSNITLFPVVFIVDCHSFEPTEDSPSSPDICLGIDDFHTPKKVKDKIVNLINSKGLSVKINDPFEGTIIPNTFHLDKRVKSIMIEVNKSLYLVKGTKEKSKTFKDTQNLVTEILNIVNEYEILKDI